MKTFIEWSKATGIFIGAVTIGSIAVIALGLYIRIIIELFMFGYNHLNF